VGGEGKRSCLFTTTLAAIMTEKHTKDDRQIEVADDLDYKEEIAHVEGGKDQYGQHTTLIEEALAQREEESKMGLWKIFKLYYPGATYGLLLSVALVMEGYDTGLVSFSSWTARSLADTVIDQQFFRSEILCQQVWLSPPRERQDFDPQGLASGCQQRSFGWTNHRIVDQRMGSNQVRLQDRLHDRDGCHDGCQSSVFH
jgi:hypothetical protein